MLTAHADVVACCRGRYKRDRRRARDYLKWLLKQRHGPLRVDPTERDDCTRVAVPATAIGFITGHRGEALRTIERESSWRSAWIMCRARAP